MGTAIAILEKMTSLKSNKDIITNFYNKVKENYTFWSKDLNVYFNYYTIKAMK